MAEEIQEQEETLHVNTIEESSKKGKSYEKLFAAIVTQENVTKFLDSFLESSVKEPTDDDDVRSLKKKLKEANENLRTMHSCFVDTVKVRDLTPLLDLLYDRFSSVICTSRSGFTLQMSWWIFTAIASFYLNHKLYFYGAFLSWIFVTRIVGGIFGFCFNMSEIVFINLIYDSIKKMLLSCM